MLRTLTAGESHGKRLLGIIEGLPAGLPLSPEDISSVLRRRRGGYGRGERMDMERDEVEILSGLYSGRTTGAPLALSLPNLGGEVEQDPWVPRPGHGELAGFLKYGLPDLVPARERASARETAIRTALGAVAGRLLAEFGIEVMGYVVSLGGRWVPKFPTGQRELRQRVLSSAFFLPQPELDDEFKKLVDEVKERGDTLGGVFEVRAIGVPPGLGSYVHWDRRLDVRLAAAIVSINGVKAVEIGEGVKGAGLPGSEFQDEILFDDRIRRKTNRAGGVESGVSNGEEIIIRGYMKPIPTLRRSLTSLNLLNLEETPAPYMRSDILAVPAASVIAEAVTCLVLADCFMEKFGGDTIEDMLASYQKYLERIGRLWKKE